MNCILLPNSLFDDGSIECKTFCVATYNEDDSFVCEYSTIKSTYPEYIERILEAIRLNKSYIQTAFGEIQWD